MPKSKTHNPDGIPAWAGIQIDREDHSPAHKLAFDLVPPTCSQVGLALNELRMEIEAEYAIKPEDAVPLDLAIHRAIAKIKANATEPLRKALIHTCGKIPQRKKKVQGNPSPPL